MNAPILPLPTSGTSAASALVSGIPSTSGPAGAVASAGANAHSTPSTDGFIQVLDLLLSDASIAQNGSEAVANLFATTSFTAGGEQVQTLSAGTVASESDETDPLDPALCSRIAALLQTMGFQVRPEQIAELKPMDREQLSTALEFASRNLARGIDPADVAENMSLLLPRSWPLEGLDAAPTANLQGPSEASDSVHLPPGFEQALEQVRAQLQPAKPSAAASSTNSAGPLSRIAPAPAGVGAGASASAATPTASGQKKTAAKPDLPVQQALLDPSAAFDLQATSSAAAPTSSDPQVRSLVPGGTASEFIGRQVLEKVHVQLTEGKRELSLRLWPDELGEVRVSLRVGDESKVKAHIVVENESVRQAMLDSMPQLRDALSRHGMDLEKMSVSVNPRDPGSADSGQASGEDGREGRPDQDRRRGSGGSRDEEISVATDLVLGRDTGRRNGYNTIDLWS